MSAIRETCGTVAGVLAHRRGGETACGFCQQAEAVAAITAEGVPTGIPVPPAESASPIGTYRPVSDDQAAEHRAALLRALDAGKPARRLRAVS
jgi:hypothetical protein